MTQRQQGSQARSLQMQASTARACRKPTMKRHFNTICASSSASVAERPVIDLDLEGADFCGPEGMLIFYHLIANTKSDS